MSTENKRKPWFDDLSKEIETLQSINKGTCTSGTEYLISQLWKTNSLITLLC